MSTLTLIPPDHRALLADLESPSFVLGVDEGRWRVVSIEWPVTLLAVSAAPRAGAPDEFVLRCDFAGYPALAPTAVPWHLEESRPLTPGERPKGDRVGFVFRSDWKEALYAPFDRVALEDHQNWATQHARFTWTPDRDVTWYAIRLHELVNDDDYQGV